MLRIEEKQDNFQEWLFYMDDVLEEFVSEMRVQNINLNYSIQSLMDLEGWILINFENINELKEKKNKYIYDKLARYVGQTFKKNISAKCEWVLDIEDEKSAYYNLPILSYNTPVCPHKLITALIDRNKGNFLSTILKHNIKKYSFS